MNPKNKAKFIARQGDVLISRISGMEPPKIFIHLDSPHSGAIGAAFLTKLKVGDQVWAQVGAQVGAQVWAQVRDQVRDQVGDQVRDQVRDQVGAQVYKCGYGQHDASWLGFYKFFKDECALDSCEKLDGLTELAQEAGWWWPFEHAVIITPKPKAINRDDRGRLHCESGPAIVYPDGWGIWAIHGVRLPQYVIETPNEITVDKIESEKNVEIRRIMIDRFPGGQVGYILASGAKEIQSDDYGTLYKKEIRGDEPIVLVRVINSTPEPDNSFKTYWLRVPPDTKTARSGVAWSFGKTEAEYEPVVQT